MDNQSKIFHKKRVAERELMKDCFGLLDEKLSFLYNNNVSFLPNRPEKIGGSCLPQFSCFLSNQKGCPS